MNRWRKWRQTVTAWLLMAVLLFGTGEAVGAATSQKGVMLSKKEIEKLLKDVRSQMKEDASKKVQQSYQEYLSDYPSGKVTGLQVIDQSVDSVTLYWSNAEVKNAQFFKVDYWMMNSPAAKNTVYVTPLTSTDPSAVITNSTSVFQLGGLSQCTYTIQITAGNYDSSSSDGRRYEKDATGVLENSYAAIFAAPQPVAPTGVKFRYLQDGYCSITAEGVNPYDQTYGVEAELYDCYTNKTILTFSSDNYQRATAAEIKSGKITGDHFYGVRVRAYWKSETSRSDSGWTEYQYAGSQMSGVTSVINNKKITLKWKKVKGASDYNVYISKKKDSGYKKVATTTGLKKVITQYNGKTLKTGISYYVKVAANYKHGGDVYTVMGTPKRVTIN